MSETPERFNVVMIIDDNKMDLYITARMVRKNQFAAEVIECSSGAEALQYISENKTNPQLLPKVIFVDIYMPLMSGFEFMEAFQQFPREVKQQCRCYIVSSSLDEKDIHRANTDPNVVAFQEKPVNADFLQTIV